jgi:hypothetical protein
MPPSSKKLHINPQRRVNGGMGGGGGCDYNDGGGYDRFGGGANRGGGYGGSRGRGGDRGRGFGGIRGKKRGGCNDVSNHSNGNNNGGYNNEASSTSATRVFNADKFVEQNRQWQIGMEQQNASIMSMLQVGKNFKIQISFVAGKISQNLQKIMAGLPNTEGEDTPIVLNESNGDDEDESTRVNVMWEDMKVYCLFFIFCGCIR